MGAPEQAMTCVDYSSILGEGLRQLNGRVPQP
jgi:hypothetical protein